MGRSKALLPIGGTTFVSRVVETLLAGGAEDIVVVAGAEADAIRDALAGSPRPVRVIENPEPARGQLSSLIVGLALVDRPGVRAALVMPVDQPLVAPETVRAVLDAYRRAPAPVVRPATGSRHGHPVIFGRSVFDELRRADPAVGAQAVVKAHAGDVLDVPVADEGAFVDVDTPEEYARLITARRFD